MANNWTYDEIVLALYAYCHVPFNKASNSHPWIIKISEIINRTPASVKMKIGNLGSFDPELKKRGIVGLTGTSVLDKEVWESYYGCWDKLVEDAEKLIQKHYNNTLNTLYPIGSEKYELTKRRLNQEFFRESVLASYNNCCCITGMTIPS